MKPSYSYFIHSTLTSMEKLCVANITLILLSILVFTISMANPIKQSPKEVENWIENLEQAQPKVTKLQFYFHNSRNAQKNLSSVQVAKAPGFSDQPPYFGVLTITDDPLTVGPEISSKRVGYAQGIFATCSLEKTSVLMAYTVFLTDGEYNGSTLAVLGRNAIGDRYRELSVVGGTGGFRMARGLVTFQTYFFNFTMGLAIVKVDAIVLHYE